MMAMLRIELSKLFHSKTLLSLFAVFLCINLAMLAYHTSLNYEKLHAYQHIQHDIEQIEQDERYAWIQNLYEKTEAVNLKQQLQVLANGDEQQKILYNELKETHAKLLSKYMDITQKDLTLYTNSLETEVQFMKEAYQEMSTLRQYPEYLKQIQAKAEHISKISIFSDKEDYSLRNINKTAKDYRHMQTVTPQYQFEKGIMEALKFPFTDFLIIFICFSIASTLVLEEKDRGLLILLRTTCKGNWKTMLIKAFAMIIFIVFTTFLFFCINLFFMEQIVGLGDLHAPLVSLASFAHSTYSISILQFLFLFLFTKAIALSVCGMLMLWVCLRVKHKLGCFIAMAILIGVELLAYVWIDEQSIFVILKQINLIAFMDTVSLFQRYQNIDFFSYPITLQYLSLCVLFLLLPLLFLIACHAYQTLNQTRSNTRYLQKIKQHVPIIPPSKHLFIQEIYKLGWIQKGVFLLLCCILLQGFTYYHQTVALTQEEYTWIQIAKPLEGKDNVAIEKALDKQIAFFDQLHLQLDNTAALYQKKQITMEEYMNLKSNIEIQLSQETVFTEIKDLFNYVKKDAHRHFLIPFAYEKLFCDDQINLIPTIILLLFLIFMLSDIECIEYQNQVNRLLMTTQKGRKNIKYHKLLLAFSCAIVFAVLCYLPNMLSLQQAYGFSDWNASITSLKQCSSLPSTMSILQFFMICNLFRLYALFAIVSLLFACSKQLKRQRFVLCTMVLLLVVPFLFSLIDIHAFEAFSFIPLFYSSKFIIENDFVGLLTSFAVCTLTSVIAFYYYQKVKE